MPLFMKTAIIQLLMCKNNKSNNTNSSRKYILFNPCTTPTQHTIHLLLSTSTPHLIPILHSLQVKIPSSSSVRQVNLHHPKQTNLAQELFTPPDLALKLGKHLRLCLHIREHRVHLRFSELWGRIRERDGAVCRNACADVPGFDLCDEVLVLVLVKGEDMDRGERH